jgi:alkylated DNA repair protein alkB homolog 6
MSASILRLARERARAERGPDARETLQATRSRTAAAADAALAGLASGDSARRAALLDLPSPPGALFAPAFLTPAQQAAVLAAVDAAAAGRWVAGGDAANPRLVANFGGQPGRLERTEPLPSFLATLAAGLAAAFGWASAPDHVLVNDYRGAAGLQHHTDGPLYSCSAVITLCGPALLELRPGDGGGGGGGESATTHTPVHLLLRPGCALGLADPAYTHWTHGIPASAADVVPPTCVNAAAAGVRVGEVVQRAPRRVSLVCVCKVARGRADD